MLQASSLGSLGGLSDDCCFKRKIATFVIYLEGALKASPLRRMRSAAPAPNRGVSLAPKEPGQCITWGGEGAASQCEFLDPESFLGAYSDFR